MGDSEQMAVDIPPDSGSSLLFKRILIAMLAQKHDKQKAYDAKRNKAYRTQKPDFIRALKREWAHRNPDKIRACARRTYHKNRQKIREYRRKWDAKPENRAKRKAYFQAKYKTIKREHIKKVAEYVKQRRKKDAIYSLLLSIRSRVWRVVKGFPKRDKNTKELLGCSMSELRCHLESQFKSGMTWLNYGRGEGKWVVDHKRPVASYDFKVHSSLEKCFHFTNLQPLWWRENMEKRDKYSPESDPQ